jgi:chromosome segregation ATPase
LRSHLIKSQQNEASLEKKLADLREELDSQKKLLKQQEQKLEKTNQMKKELDEAKKTSLQLANANSAIEQEVKQLRKQLEDFQPKPTQLSTKSAPLPVRQIRKEGKHLHFPSQANDNYDDFASNTWLLD